MTRLHMNLRAALIVAALSAAADAVPLEYKISGTAVYDEGPDTALDGAFIEFTARIDSEAEPFDVVEPDEIAQYYFEAGSVTLAVSGSPASDGVYGTSVPFVLFVGNLDAGSLDEIVIGREAGSDKPFEIAGSLAGTFGIGLFDWSATALDDTSVPLEVFLNDYDYTYAGLGVFTSDGVVAGYTLTNVEFTIWPIPELSSLTSLGAMSVVVTIVYRRSRSQRVAPNRSHRRFGWHPGRMSQRMRYLSAC